MKAATAADMRRIEQLAVEETGVSFATLMGRAGQAAAEDLRARIGEIMAARRAAGKPDAPVRVAIVCGRGNNGGDGFVIARQLAVTAEVTVILACGQPVTQIAADALSRLQGRAEVSLLDHEDEPYICRSAVRTADIVVDCLYGIGFHGELPESVRPLIQQMNMADGLRVAIDMPSGRTCGGENDPDAFRPDVTLTFTAMKAGLDDGCGEVRVLPIGIDDALIDRVLGQSRITEELVAGCLPPRPADSHKGTFGQVLIVAGSYGMAGAALLCARGALRSGAGLVRLAVPRSVYPLLAGALPEAVFLPLPETPQGQLSAEAEDVLDEPLRNANAVVMGCGLGRGEAIAQLVGTVCGRARCPVVLDADGINALSTHMLLAETAPAPLILTPHPGEMARLLDVPTAEVQRHREEIARRFADDHGVTLVLKGHRTLVTASGRALLCNETGNPGMATGGSGDVLAGIIGALVAQGIEPYYAAACGVYLHGAAGDAAAARLSQHAMLPSDLIGELGHLFLKFEK